MVWANAHGLDRKRFFSSMDTMSPPRLRPLRRALAVSRSSKRVKGLLLVLGRGER